MTKKQAKKQSKHEQKNKTTTEQPNIQTNTKATSINGSSALSSARSTSGPVAVSAQSTFIVLFSIISFILLGVLSHYETDGDEYMICNKTVALAHSRASVFKFISQMHTSNQVTLNEQSPQNNASIHHT